MEAPLQRIAARKVDRPAAPATKKPSRRPPGQVMANLETIDGFASSQCAYINHLAEEARRRIQSGDVASADEIVDLIAHGALQLSDSIGECAAEVDATSPDRESLRQDGIAEANLDLGNIETTAVPAASAPPQSGTILSLASVDYVSERISQAYSIVWLAHTAIDLADDEQPDSAAVFVSLQRASELLSEVQFRLDDSPETRAQSLGASDPWWNSVQQARLMLDTLDAIAWSDGYVIRMGQNILADYLWAVRETIEQAREGLDAAFDAKAEKRNG